MIGMKQALVDFAFGIIGLLETADRPRDQIRDYAGLWTERPALAGLMTVFLLSLGGFPPMAGFIAKWYVFSAAVKAGYTWLAIIGVLTSVVSVFFYLRVVVQMYMTPGGNTPRVLEIRSKLGSLSAILTRLYRARCSVMTIFENQRFLAEEVYGLPAAWPIDFDQFSIPFDGTFDLIVSNHMLTHAVHPREFLKTVRSRLALGGYLYLYQEPLATEFLA